MSQKRYTLVVVDGPLAGRHFPVTPAGLKLGRSSVCDIAITDPALSRSHCQFELRGDSLWLVDLASANQTFVNETAADEKLLAPGDLVRAGDTLLRVDIETAEVPVATLDVSATPPGQASDVVIDLGFGKDDAAPAAAHKQVLVPVLWAVGAIVILTASVFAILKFGKPAPTVRPAPAAKSDALLLAYEKVEATPENLFRYELTLSPAGNLKVRIDDLGGDRHLQEEKQIDPAFLSDLAREVESSGFFALEPAYTGFPANANTLKEWTLTAALGKKAHTCRITNREEPESFKNLREKLETFSKNELGIWAIQHTAAELIQLASDALALGQKKLEEREVNPGNLAAALRAFREADYYLRTVNPKPEFHPAIALGTQTATAELDARYRDLNFRAEKAINLADWHTAARELKILCELIPDRSDPRNREATRKLLDVEQRLLKQRAR